MWTDDLGVQSLSLAVGAALFPGLTRGTVGCVPSTTVASQLLSFLRNPVNVLVLVPRRPWPGIFSGVGSSLLPPEKPLTWPEQARGRLHRPPWGVPPGLPLLHSPSLVFSLLLFLPHLLGLPLLLYLPGKMRRFLSQEG